MICLDELLAYFKAKKDPTEFEQRMIQSLGIEIEQRDWVNVNCLNQSFTKPVSKYNP